MASGIQPYFRHGNSLDIDEKRKYHSIQEQFYSLFKNYSYHRSMSYHRAIPYRRKVFLFPIIEVYACSLFYRISICGASARRRG